MDRAQAGTGDNHAISALKFKIIREFLELGWNVLLSDVDIVVVQVTGPDTPFEQDMRLLVRMHRHALPLVLPRTACRPEAVRVLPITSCLEASL